MLGVGSDKCKGACVAGTKRGREGERWKIRTERGQGFVGH